MNTSENNTVRCEQTKQRKQTRWVWQKIVKSEILKLHRRGEMFDLALLEWARQ
jgi:hypothetical protein